MAPRRRSELKAGSKTTHEKSLHHYPLSDAGSSIWKAVNQLKGQVGNASLLVIAP